MNKRPGKGGTTTAQLRTLDRHTALVAGERATATDRPVVLRLRRVTIPFASLGLFIAGGAVSVAAAAATIAGVVLALAIAAVSVMLGVRAWRAALVASDGRVTIRNAFYTRSWRWDEVGEIGWDTPAWNVRGEEVRAVTVCALGDAHTYSATSTSTRPGGKGARCRGEFAAALDPLLQARGVANRILDDDPATPRWSLDPRSHRVESEAAQRHP